MAERGVSVDHATLNRWAVRYSPLIADEAKNRKQSVAGAWRMAIGERASAGLARSGLVWHVWSGVTPLLLQSRKSGLGDPPKPINLLTP